MEIMEILKTIFLLVLSPTIGALFFRYVAPSLVKPYIVVYVGSFLLNIAGFAFAPKEYVLFFSIPFILIGSISFILMCIGTVYLFLKICSGGIGVPDSKTAVFRDGYSQDLYQSTHNGDNGGMRW